MYDHGYMYPGPAIHNVPIEMAPRDSQETIRKFGRPEYQELIANNPVEPPLDAKPIVAMFDKWDRDIGGGKQRSSLENGTIAERCLLGPTTNAAEANSPACGCE